MDYLNESKLFMEKSIEQFFSEGSSRQINREYLVEHELSIYIDGQKSYEIICTNICIKELVVGRLAGDGIIGSADDIENLECCENDRCVSVKLKRNRERAKLQNVLPCRRLNHAQICSMIEVVNSDMHIHKKTSGTHSCYLFQNGENVCACEDIGRHNALDKVIGHMLLNNIRPEECAVFTTGRVPLDAIRKLTQVSIFAIVTKSVPTLQALESAERNGIQLISRAWPDSYEINFTGETNNE